MTSKPTVKKATKTTAKATPKKAKEISFKHGVRIEGEKRKLIVKSVDGTATNYLDEAGKKVDRRHTVKYTAGGKNVVTEMQIIRWKAIKKHTKKDILELTNSKGTVYYFEPMK